jgi:lincosamide nucleotidyltransferase A/C/D/E
MMTADDVLRVLDLLEEAGVDVWLDGGWGIDALLREQTRPHNDLDIAMRHEDVPLFMQAMGQAGFWLVEGGTPKNFVVVDDQGHEVDVHLVDINTTELDDQGVERYGPNGLGYEVGSLEGHGTVLGREVSCCTAEFQIVPPLISWTPH